MIKAQTTINGVVSRAATIRQTSDGKRYVSFTVKVNVPGSRNNMAGKEVFVSVSKEGSEADLGNFAVGNRIEMSGLLTFRKSGDNLYFNFLADTVNLHPESQKDGIEGTVEFKGTVGKNMVERTDKKGGKYVAFSAFSTEKANDQLLFTWMRFVKFNYEPEDFMQAKAKIYAKGKLGVSAYDGRIDLDCRIDELKPWERLPFAPSNPNETVPF